MSSNISSSMNGLKQRRKYQEKKKKKKDPFTAKIEADLKVESGKVLYIFGW